MMNDEITTESDFDEVDREALNRALQLSLKGADHGHAQQVRGKLNEDGWWEATSFASYHHQIEELGLRPWESPPCYGDTEDSSRLLSRMLAHNVSQWDPTPIDSINNASMKGKSK